MLPHCHQHSGWWDSSSCRCYFSRGVWRATPGRGRLDGSIEGDPPRYPWTCRSGPGGGTGSRAAPRWTGRWARRGPPHPRMGTRRASAAISGVMTRGRPKTLPRAWRSSAMIRTSFTERPRRSSFQTARMSPDRRIAITASSPGRSVLRVETCSSKICVQPALRRASRPGPNRHPEDPRRRTASG